MESKESFNFKIQIDLIKLLNIISAKIVSNEKGFQFLFS